MWWQEEFGKTWERSNFKQAEYDQCVYTGLLEMCFAALHGWQKLMLVGISDDYSKASKDNLHIILK